MGFGVRWLRERNEPVARPVSGEDMAWGLRINFQFLPQLRDMNIDRSRMWQASVAPHFPEEGFPRNPFIQVRNEIAQQFEFPGRQLDRKPVAQDLLLFQVDDHVAKRKDRLGQLWRQVVRSAKQGFNARQELRDFKRLKQVIVGADFQSPYAIIEVTSGGDHEDGDID